VSVTRIGKVNKYIELWRGKRKEWRHL